MTILLDTHVWPWAVMEPERLKRKTADLLRDPDVAVFLSLVSSWEIAIKYGKGKLSLPEPPVEFIPSRLDRDHIELMPIEHRHVLHVVQLPHHHRDPFDRLLVAQSQLESVPIVTHDRRIQEYAVEVIEAI